MHKGGGSCAPLLHAIAEFACNRGEKRIYYTNAAVYILQTRTEENMSASREKRIRFEERAEGKEKRQIRAKDNRKVARRKKLITTAAVAVIVIVLVLLVVLYGRPRPSDRRFAVHRRGLQL